MIRRRLGLTDEPLTKAQKTRNSARQIGGDFLKNHADKKVNTTAIVL